ncbi:MAG: alpha/beta hydrolase domain-containing protein [Actinomycetota bacterium]|nr:alpha/beta hydrolase domain-containing protein [Actinomycetota bacterium]
MSARPGPDLTAAGYAESEWAVAGTASSYAADDLPTDGRWTLSRSGEADFVTRAMLRRPADSAAFSGTLVAEWLNVSSGADAAPDWTYLADEIVRRGHAWVGISAQHVGVEGGSSAVGDLGLGALKAIERYAALCHPGDAFAYGIFAEVVAALDTTGPASDLDVECRLAIGESQSAYALTSYANGVHPITAIFDGFLIHSRGGAAMPVGDPGRAVDIASFRAGPPTRIRDDLDVPVILVQTETDLLGHLDYLPARQPDGERLRLWEVAGAAHADKFQIGEFEDFLGCPDLVNRGQQAYVVRAALRHLDSWARGGDPAPAAARLGVDGGTFVLDDVGNATGGVRTPVVDAPVEVLSGLADPGASAICRLFGTTRPLAGDDLARLYPGGDAEHRAAYERATDAAIAAGFVLAEDRTEILNERRTP